MTQSDKPAPKPGPKPGSRVGTPPAHSTGRLAPTVSDPQRFGRADQDGTVWLITSSGERQVGVFHAGTPDEGLAHFAARFDDLATEVALLETRLNSHPEEAARIRQDATGVLEGLDSAAVVGDVERLGQQLRGIIERSYSAEQQANEDKLKRREDAVAAKTRLADEAEQIGSSSTDWKASGDRFRAMVDEWRSIRGVDRSTDDELWARFSAAREAFNKRRGSHFADLDRQRAQAQRTKEDLIERAEQLSTSTDWAATSRAYKDLMQEWKAAGRAPREVEDALWQRFRAAQDTFFDARHADQSKRDAEFEANATAKLALLDEYREKTDPDQGLDQAKAALRELQDKWESIGFVPRGRVSEFENKIRELEQRVDDAEQAQWRQTDPQLQARVEQFRSKAEQLAREAETAEAKGNAKKAATLREQSAQWVQWATAAQQAVD